MMLSASKVVVHLPAQRYTDIHRIEQYQSNSTSILFAAHLKISIMRKRGPVSYMIFHKIILYRNFIS